MTDPNDVPRLFGQEHDEHLEFSLDAAVEKLIDSMFDRMAPMEVEICEFSTISAIELLPPADLVLMGVVEQIADEYGFEGFLFALEAVVTTEAADKVHALLTEIFSGVKFYLADRMVKRYRIKVEVDHGKPGYWWIQGVDYV